MSQVHVLWSKKDRQWEIKLDRFKGTYNEFDKKQHAVSCARELSRRLKGELVIHTKDGKIAQKDSHGNDPKQSKG